MTLIYFLSIVSMFSSSFAASIVTLSSSTSHRFELLANKSLRHLFLRQYFLELVNHSYPDIVQSMIDHHQLIIQLEERSFASLCDWRSLWLFFSSSWKSTTKTFRWSSHWFLHTDDDHSVHPLFRQSDIRWSSFGISMVPCHRIRCFSRTRLSYWSKARQASYATDKNSLPARSASRHRTFDDWDLLRIWFEPWFLFPSYLWLLSSNTRERDSNRNDHFPSNLSNLTQLFDSILGQNASFAFLQSASYLCMHIENDIHRLRRTWLSLFHHSTSTVSIHLLRWRVFVFNDAFASPSILHAFPSSIDPTSQTRQSSGTEMCSVSVCWWSVSTSTRRWNDEHLSDCQSDCQRMCLPVIRSFLLLECRETFSIRRPTWEKNPEPRTVEFSKPRSLCLASDHCVRIERIKD